MLTFGLLATPARTGVLSLLVKIVIAGLIAYVLLWALGKIALPEPFNKIALVIIVLAIAYYVITLLLAFA